MPEPINPQGGSAIPSSSPQQTVNPAADEGVIQIPQSDVHPDLLRSPHPDQTRTYPVVVNGRAENWTLEKLTAEAQTGAAGREAFQQAAETRKENATALATQEDLAAVFKDGDIDAFRRLGAQHGVPSDEVEKIAARTFLNTEEGDEGEEADEAVVNSYLKEEAEESTDGKTRSRKSDLVDYSRLSPDVQRVLRESEKGRIDGIVKMALDKDEVIAYNLEAQSPEGRRAIRNYVDEKIRGRLDAHAGDFGDGSRILAEVLPEIRTHLQALGTPGQRTLTGLGQAPGGGDTEVHPTKLPDHVPSTEGDGFDQHILETLAFHKAQSERGKL